MLVVADRAGRSLCVELVRVVEDGCLCRPGSLPVVVASDGVEELGQDGRVEVRRPLFAHPQAEMDMAEEATLLGLAERGAPCELANPAEVVEERGGEKEVGPESRVKLGRLAAERGDADRMLEEPSGIAVMTVDPRGGQRPEAGEDLRVAHESAHESSEARVGDLGGKELEEAVELLGIAPERGRERRGIGVLRRLHGAHLKL